MKYGLGLDLGSGSVGWAVVEVSNEAEPRNCKPVSVQKMGVRRFDAGVSGDISRGRDESNAVQRRQKRAPRRQHWRRAFRMRKLFEELVRLGLLPECNGSGATARHATLADLDSELRSEFPSVNVQQDHLLPYRLRARALDHELPPFALGRAIYSLAQRRGFLSNRKALSEDDNEQSVVKCGISDLESEMEEANARTLGEYFASIDPEEVRLRRRWTARRMFVMEFDMIWEQQSKHHDVLTDDVYRKLKKRLFFQRPLKSQRGLVGRCELEKHPVTLEDGTKRFVGRRRCMKACLPFQEFRLLQKINDLQFTEPNGNVRSLSEPEFADLRDRLLDKLSDQGEITFSAMRKLFGFKKSKEFDRNYVFNFESDGDAKFIGNRTAAKLSKILGPRWHGLSEHAQNSLVDEILQHENVEPLRRRLVDEHKIDEATAEKLSKVVLEDGFGSISRRAINRLLPHMREGLNFHDAKIAAGYNANQEAHQVFELLPPVIRELPELRNPAVLRVLTEMKKVVNAIIRQMGEKPVWIRVELARDLKHSRKRRQDFVSMNRKNEKERLGAKKRITDELDESHASDTNILKIRLAEECGWVCPYSGEQIGFVSLVGNEPQFEIEHIIPLSRSLDNSFLNKTLCKSSVNREKRNKTPWEAFGGTPDYEAMLGRVRRFQGDARDAKLKRFSIQDIAEGDEFANRQLNETRYAARLATRYLALLYGGLNLEGESQRVFPTSGRITAYLRQRWQLNSLIGHADEKNRADHRHHAIDALVTALSTPSAVHQLAKAAERTEQTGAKLFAEIDPPFSGLLDQAGECVDEMYVSSRVHRKISGALHEETILSHPIDEGTDEKGRSIKHHHVRKALNALSVGEVEQIVDARIKQLVKETLAAIGKPPKDAFKDDQNLPALHGKNGRTTIVRKVKIRKADHPIEVGSDPGRRYVNPGANHHMMIVATIDENGNEKRWSGHTVSRFDAVARNRNKHPVIEKPSKPEIQFKFSICGGDHLLLDRGNGDELCRVVVISGNNLELVAHSNANPITIRKKMPGERIRCSVSKLKDYKARKVDVLPYGTITEAHD